MEDRRTEAPTSSKDLRPPFVLVLTEPSVVLDRRQGHPAKAKGMWELGLWGDAISAGREGCDLVGSAAYRRVAEWRSRSMVGTVPGGWWMSWKLSWA